MRKRCYSRLCRRARLIRRCHFASFVAYGEKLAFSLFIGTDILRAHRAVLTLDKRAPVRLRNRECFICRKQRTKLPVVSPPAFISAFTACSAVIEPCTATFIRGRGPSVLRREANVAVKPIASLLEHFGCAALPSSIAR